MMRGLVGCRLLLFVLLCVIITCIINIIIIIIIIIIISSSSSSICLGELTMMRGLVGCLQALACMDTQQRGVQWEGGAVEGGSTI